MSDQPQILSEPLPLAEPPASVETPVLVKRTRWQMFPSTATLWALLILLTAVGAFLRFWRMDEQAYWTDETATLNRIKGTFDYMLGMLNDQGFPPGWYAGLRWWCMLVEKCTGSGAVAFSANSTRSLTAICGTLTLPAIYFLARQFTDRKGSLLVLILAVVNPFLIYYSRDIKMYGPLWLFTTLNIAIFFKWQTTHKHLVWWPWFVLTGVMMTLLQENSWLIIALELIFLLTRPRLKSLDGPLWLLGTGFMALVPIYWYLNRSSWLTRVAEQDSGGGLDWIRLYTDMSWKTIGSLPTAHILGYLLPTYPPNSRMVLWFRLGNDFKNHLDTRSLPWLASAELYVAIAVAAILVIGLVPWRGMRRSAERKEAVTSGRWWWIALWLIIPTVALVITWTPEDWPLSKWLFHDHPPPSVWEPRYLGMLVPAWLIWLAASLRRLPTWPLRTVAILFVVTVCTLSSLSNHLVYRTAPYNREAAIFMRYFNPKMPRGTAIASVGISYPGIVEDTTYQLARGMRPNMTSWGTFVPDENWRRQIWDTAEYLDFLREARVNPFLRTIIVTDRNGDITDPKDPLSNESVQTLLGKRWQLADEEEYRWYYEWRFYIFHTWRTRVWTRVTTPPASQSQPATNPAR